MLGSKKRKEYTKAAPEMTRIINEAINQFMYDSSEVFRQFYTDIANRNKELIKYVKKENQNMSYAEANILAKIDVLSFFFKTNH